MVKKGLGKGLGALISTDDTNESGIMEIRINEIEPNLEQPRKNFDEEKLAKLAESIRKQGVIQPIIVKRENDIYKIVAGERRWRAARLAGLETIPAIVKDISSKEVMEIALVENLQRQDLNPLEEADAYEKLIKEYNMTQEELSSIIGKSRSAIANTLRLLTLDDTIKKYIIDESITSGHARALVSIEDKELQHAILKEILDKQLSVRETEMLIKKMSTVKKIKKQKVKNENFIEIEEKLKSILGTKVQITSKNKKGKIMIEYYSDDDLNRILDMFDKLS